MFYGRRKPTRLPTVRVGDTYIQAGNTLKYLGIIFDSRLCFGDHFRYVAAKASRVASALGMLMSNLRGPSEVRRSLYANTVMSVIMYGAPLWWDATAPVTASARRRLAPVVRVQRFIALRVISAYRSVSVEAATLLARIPPVYLLAGFYARTYTRVRELKRSEDWSPQAEKEIRVMEKLLLHRQWRIHIASGTNHFSLRVRAAVLPIFNEWIDHPRKWGMNFHLTQILTGHGCFGDYLHRIGREASSACFHCGDALDTAQHTLEDCSAWLVERSDLRQVIGPIISLPFLMRVMLTSEDN